MCELLDRKDFILYFFYQTHLSYHSTWRGKTAHISNFLSCYDSDYQYNTWNVSSGTEKIQ